MADEINRTPPKTQSALLEAMQEKQVTIGGRTHRIDPPFFVLATQIPIEQEGTYPLPEAQQDRFMFSVVMTYLDEDEEVEVVRSSTGRSQPELRRILGGKELLAYQTIIRDTEVPPELSGYIVDLVGASRPGTPSAPEFVNDYISWGAGLRASQYIVLGAKSRAAMSGRNSAAVDDVRAVIVPSLRHRIGLNFRADVDKVRVEDIVERLIKHVPAPAVR
jgi:MoxR-like ATPase